jgi:hypothetical protein
MSEAVKTKKTPIFSILCPYLGRIVTLKRETWLFKIIPEHPEVSNRLELIKEVLSKDDPDILKYKKRRDHHKMAIMKKCPHLLPYNLYIKIGLYLKSENEAVVTTIHGRYNLPGKDMEEIK